ncbi:hypothetical protein V3C99_010546 [Haemonchus contortus]|uniref:Trimeric intracellular cation channel type B n=1 Tax=Haemonchus contortus TaxID=6289 RepID=U6PRH5_HAECO|nr:Protein of unknown function DUF714 domain containing protein [Haemonchus contortus]
MWSLDWEMDHESLISAGGALQKLRMYPYFDIAHYLLMCEHVRWELGTSAIAFSRRHPFSCWLSSMLMCFAGGLLACFLLGEPVITPFRRHDDVVLASIVWYSVFYSPFDLVHKMLCFKPVKVLVSVVKEVQRAHKISHGVAYATKLYPESYMVQVLVGVSKGCGSGIVKIIEQLVRGTWIPSQHEMLRPTFTTKACVVASLVFTLERNSMYVTAPQDLVYLCVVAFFVYFKLSALLLGVVDPFAPVENLFCAIFMGGICDALYKAVDATREEATAGKKKLDDDLVDDKKWKKNDKKTK